MDSGVLVGVVNTERTPKGTSVATARSAPTAGQTCGADLPGHARLRAARDQPRDLARAAGFEAAADFAVRFRPAFAAGPSLPRTAATLASSAAIRSGAAAGSCAAGWTAISS